MILSYKSKEKDDRQAWTELWLAHFRVGIANWVDTGILVKQYGYIVPDIIFADFASTELPLLINTDFLQLILLMFADILSNIQVPISNKPIPIMITLPIQISQIGLICISVSSLDIK